MGEVSFMGEVSNRQAQMNSPLLPDRNPKGDLFVCDIFDAAPKTDIGSMEHPIFSLSTGLSRMESRWTSTKESRELRGCHLLLR